MKKKIVTVLGALVVLAGGLGIYQLSATTTEAKLSLEEAEEKAQTQFPGKVVEIELDEKGKHPIYEIEIEGTEKSYELVLDGDTGKILNLEEKSKRTNKTTERTKETQQPQASGQNGDDQGDDNKSGKSDDKDDNKQNSSTSENTTEKVVISVEKAKEIALNEVKEANGKIIELELDEDDGHLYYEIEMHTDTHEVEIEINAYSGEVIVVSMESFDD